MKRFVLVIVAISFAVAGYTQPRFSLIGSPELAWFNSDKSTVENNGMSMKFSWGFTCDYYKAPNYAFTIGVLMNYNGASLKYDAQPGQSTIPFQHSGTTSNLTPGSVVDYKLHYIDIPFGLKFKTEHFGQFDYYAQIGLTPQMLTNATGTSDPLFNDADIPKEVTTFNMAWHIGGGVEYVLQRRTALTFGILFTNGFSDITTNAISDKVILNNLALRIGVVF